MQEVEGYYSPFNKLMDFRITGVADGASTITLEFRQELTNRNGSLHGGVVSALVDTALSQAVRSLLQKGEASATVELKVNFIRPGTGNLTAQGKVIHRGRMIAVSSVEVKNESGAVVAVGLGTTRIFAATSADGEPGADHE